MLKEASFLYLEKILLNDESAITTGIQSEYCIDIENHRSEKKNEIEIAAL